jgi:hypothetical protein
LIAVKFRPTLGVMNIERKSLVGVIMVGMVLASSCRHRIPPEYEYSRGWITEDHEAVRAASLSGTVADPSGAPRQFVLVERMTADSKTRLDATLTDSKGRFHLRATGNGPFYLSFRFQGFNDYRVPVEGVPQSPARLQITLNEQLTG